MTEQELLEASGGEIIGGAVIAMVEGKHTVLGKRGPGGVFNLTGEGVFFVESLKGAPAQEQVAETAKVSKPRSKKAQAEQAAGTETPAETATETGTEQAQTEGQTIDLGLDELVNAAETIG